MHLLTLVLLKENFLILIKRVHLFSSYVVTEIPYPK